MHVIAGFVTSTITTVFPVIYESDIPTINVCDELTKGENIIVAELVLYLSPGIPIGPIEPTGPIGPGTPFKFILYGIAIVENTPFILANIFNDRIPVL